MLLLQLPVHGILRYRAVEEILHSEKTYFREMGVPFLVSLQPIYSQHDD